MEPEPDQNQPEAAPELDFFKEHESLEQSENFYSAQTKFSSQPATANQTVAGRNENSSTTKSSATSAASIGPGPNVSGALQADSNPIQQTDRKSTIGVRKIQPKRSGVGLDSGMRSYRFEAID